MPYFYRVKRFLFFKTIYKWLLQHNNISIVKYCISLSERFRSEAYSEPPQIYNIDPFANIAHGFRLLNISVGSCISNVRLGSECHSTDRNPLLTFSNSKATELFAAPNGTVLK